MNSEIQQAIQDAIEKAINQEIEKEMEFVKKRVEKAVREKTGAIAVRLMSCVDFESLRDRLVITVNMTNLKD